MSMLRRPRLTSSIVFALAVGGVAAARVAGLGPRLEIQVLRRFDRPGFVLCDVRVIPRGGETIGEVTLEPLRGAVRVSPPGRTTDLRPGAVFWSRVTVTPNSDVPPAIRIFQRGRVDRHYDVELGENRL